MNARTILRVGWVRERQTENKNSFGKWVGWEIGWRHECEQNWRNSDVMRCLTDLRKSKAREDVGSSFLGDHPVCACVLHSSYVLDLV
mmetsp:Transcript_2754/g.4207  ORF Transcript_2754/g.4207 Transcript_2754/m.4207 type:complete len:87 (+) Transcript_2754:60-320(+)